MGMLQRFHGRFDAIHADAPFARHSTCNARKACRWIRRPRLIGPKLATPLASLASPTPYIRFATAHQRDRKIAHAIDATIYQILFFEAAYVGVAKHQGAALAAPREKPHVLHAVIPRHAGGIQPEVAGQPRAHCSDIFPRPRSPEYAHARSKGRQRSGLHRPALGSQFVIAGHREKHPVVGHDVLSCPRSVFRNRSMGDEKRIDGSASHFGSKIISRSVGIGPSHHDSQTRLRPEPPHRLRKVPPKPGPVVPQKQCRPL